MLKAILIGTHDGLNTRVDTSLRAGCSLLDTHLWQTGLDGLSHTAQLLNLLNMLPSLVNQFVGQSLHIVRTSPWVNLLADLSLVLDVDLSVTSDTGREVGRQSDSLVEGVGVQTLGVAQYCSHSLDTGTTYVVEGILLGERPTRGLRVCTQRQRLRILSAKALNNLSPQQTTSTHLGNLHEVVHTDSPEEAESWSESIHIDTSIHTSTQVVHTIGQGVSQLDVSRCTSLLHVIA